MLEDKLGREVCSFCPPYNQWNDELLSEIEEAGYRTISISFPVEPLPPWSGYILPRLGVYLYDIPAVFKAKLQMRPLMPLVILAQKFTNLAAQGPVISRRLRGA